jgi:hypothetical protein
LGNEMLYYSRKASIISLLCDGIQGFRKQIEAHFVDFVQILGNIVVIK